MNPLVKGDRVEVDVSKTYDGYKLVRGTVTLIDNPQQGVESICYYITFDEPLARRQEGRYSMVSGRAEPVFHYVHEICVNHKEKRWRKLTLLELLAEAAQ